jgi:Protein of unknown function (DUF1559)
MKQLGLACHTYAAEHGTLPPAAVRGIDERPLLSWRVLLLPYIDQEELYREFRLDEPWDSEHNIRLLERMPTTYAAPGYLMKRIPPNHSVCHVFVGPGTAFEGPRGLAWKDFPDGQSSTILIVEAGEPVPWTKPEEIAFGPNIPIRLRTLFRDDFRVAMADGSMRFVRKDIDEARLRAAITRNGGESIGLGW